MARKENYNLDYLYRVYKRFYREGNMLRAKKYKDLAKEYHNIDIETHFHQFLERKEERTGPFGIGEYNEIKYG
jgi:acyl-[acyl carrier protein]--UDP-N-acetylglucosamine O-acyltransferase|tara:strand:- start:173 stop:391 length:219 start_codon:yes stop_codon:yes gene_type:complete